MIRIIRFLPLMLIMSANLPAGYYTRNYKVTIHNNEIETVGKVIVGAGILALAGYGLYKVCDWLFSPSDEQVLQNSTRELQRVQEKYAAAKSYFERAYGSLSENIYAQKQMIKNIGEDGLYEYAVHYKQETVSACLSGISNTLHSLKSARGLLGDRIVKLRANQTKLSLRQDLQRVEQGIADMICALDFMHEYFRYHQSYYEIFEIEAALLQRYEFELNALYASQGNVAYLKEAVRSCVMKQLSTHTGYPYMRYIDRIQADCKNLASGLGNMPHYYGNRLQAAGSLLQNVQTIHSLVVCEDAYHQELRDYKREQLERERLEAERAKAAAALAQASALQEQAWHMQRQNQLHAEQIRVDAERNAIMATQAIVNAINPPQQVHVHL